MQCPLCQKRPAKRACPALRQQICPICCATKRQVEIACPSDCVFLETAHRHPAAVVKRQIDQDVGILMATLGNISERQLQLFFILQTIVVRHKPSGLTSLEDLDVAQAAAALATTLESASKGVIFDESTNSPVAEALRRELKPIVDEVAKSGGSRSERDSRGASARHRTGGSTRRRPGWRLADQLPGIAGAGAATDAPGRRAAPQLTADRHTLTDPHPEATRGLTLGGRERPW